VSRTFYEKLGFKFIVGPVGPEPVAIVEHPCGVNFNLFLNTSKEVSSTNILMDEPLKYPGYAHVALEITDAKPLSEKIIEICLTNTGEVDYEGQSFFSSP